MAPLRHGWREGRTVAIEYRWADGRTERFVNIATEFINLGVDVIVTAGTEAVVALMQATSVIPIVFATAGDPVANKLVVSLARPGGNVTGVSSQSNEVAGKRLELLGQVVPSLRLLAIIANPGNPNTALDIAEIKTAAMKIGLEIETLEIRRADDIASSFEAIRGAAALYVVSDPLVTVNRELINKLALARGLPTIHGQRANVEAGGLISYGVDFRDSFRRAADYVNKVLNGIKPAEIPIEQPTKFEMVINLKTAKALGLVMPPTLLALADEVIE
jgi:putative ABC transport system substrate-binding protein